MAYNGAGVFQLAAGNPVVTGTIISSTWANNTLADIANNGLTNCITKDGQQTVTANIPFNGNRLTGIGNAVNLQDAVTAAQFQNNGLTTLSSVSGTDTITATASPVPAAYVAGQRFQFIATGANTTTAVTLNISSLGAKNVTKNGASALAAGDIASGAMVSVVYDGTQFQIAAEPSGKLIGVQTFTASGTYTPTPGMRSVIFEVQGGGAGGGGASGSGIGSNVSLGSPGGCGTYAKGRFTAASVGASQSVTIGAGGNGGINANGTSGGQSSVGSLIIAPGGTAGTVSNNIAPPSVTGNGTLSSAPTGANIFGVRGAGGTVCIAISSSVAASGNGGASPFGPGGNGPGINTNGTSAVNYGAGGSGIVLNSSGGTGTGGNGFAGIVIAWEYA